MSTRLAVAIPVLLLACASCLLQPEVTEQSTSFLEEVTWLEGVDPAEVVADVHVNLEFLPSNLAYAGGVPADPAAWAGFLGAQPEFLDPGESAGEPSDPGAAQQAEAPQAEAPQAEAAPPRVGFSWADFLRDKASEGAQKEGLLLANAGLIAVAIPSPIPEPTDAVAAAVLAVGTVIVVVHVTSSIAADPRVQQLVADAASSAYGSVRVFAGHVANTLSSAIARAVRRPAYECPALVPIARPALTTPAMGGIPAGWFDLVNICSVGGLTVVTDRSAIVLPPTGTGPVVLEVMNLGAVPLFVRGQDMITRLAAPGVPVMLNLWYGGTPGWLSVATHPLPVAPTIRIGPTL